MLATFGRADVHLLNIGTHRIACKDNLLAREEAVHALVGDTYLAGFTGENFVGKTSIRVLLLQKSLIAHGGSGLESRLAGETAHTHNNVGSEIPDNSLHHLAALEDAEGKLEILDDIGRGELALQTCDGQTYNLVACRRHFLHLHAPFGTYKENLNVAPTSLDGIGNCHCGEYVSAAASTTDDYFHIA